MFTPIEENYLKAIFSLSSEKEEVNVKDLSEKLGLKMPSVTSMVRKLAAKNLIQYETYKPLKLTDIGKKEAALVIRKHRLTEMFLVEKMGFGWEDVHEIAEQVEHIRSKKFFDKMDELLDYPKIDPHGSPIPDKDGKIENKAYLKLSECKKGDQVKLVAVANSSLDFLKFLNSRNLQLGERVIINTVESFDKSLNVSYGNYYDETLSAIVAERLFVEKIMD